MDCQCHNTSSSPADQQPHCTTFLLSSPLSEEQTPQTGVVHCLVFVDLFPTFCSAHTTHLGEWEWVSRVLCPTQHIQLTSETSLSRQSLALVLTNKLKTNKRKYTKNMKINKLAVHCVSEKTSPFHICDNLVRHHPILPILGRNIPKGIWNKHMYTQTHHISLLYVRTVTCKKLATTFMAHNVHFPLLNAFLGGPLMAAGMVCTYLHWQCKP